MTERVPPRRGSSAPAGRGERTIARAVDEFLAVQGYGEARHLAAVTACWAEVVGPDVAAHVVPRALRDRRLVLAVDHATWASELAFLGERILSGLAERVGDGVVERLEVTVAG